ncbi:MAG: hypothetical protein QOF11_720 [Chloroflexota bacterium]|nr:hypothetical protein [Chloroflexota bacterium]
MTRPAASLPAAAALFLGVAVALAGCVGSGGGASGTPTGGTATASAAGSSAATRSERPGPVTPTPGGSAVASPPTTTKTAWGRIWDALPATFPTYPGAEPADGGAGPASAVLAVPADVATVVDWYRQALGAAGYSIEALAGPMEDGSTVIDAVGLEPACRVQASIGPRGSHTLISILFAADCPFR